MPHLAFLVFFVFLKNFFLQYWHFNSGPHIC
jgi:hypothetical protein